MDLEKMSESEFNDLMNKLSTKVSDKIDRTIKYLNDILSPYGLEVYLMAKIIKKDDIVNLNKDEIKKIILNS